MFNFLLTTKFAFPVAFEVKTVAFVALVTFVLTNFDAFNSASTFNYKFINSLIKIADTVATSNLVHWENIFKNNLPGIKNPSIGDYSLDTLAYAKDKGDITIGSYYTSDILGNPRTYLPDLGAYERQDNK